MTKAIANPVITFNPDAAETIGRGVYRCGQHYFDSLGMLIGTASFTDNSYTDINLDIPGLFCLELSVNCGSKFKLVNFYFTDNIAEMDEYIYNCIAREINDTVFTIESAIELAHKYSRTLPPEMLDYGGCEGTKQFDKITKQYFNMYNDGLISSYELAMWLRRCLEEEFRAK